MKADGRDRQEWFKDATRRLAEVVADPVGSGNYVAWFQKAWLLWKHEENIADAEEAFYTAARLSSPEPDAYHVRALRHLAYMQYLQGKHEEAYQTIQKALAISTEHDVCYDAARYAAKTGREEEALALLESCIDLEPQTIVTMFSEEDFLG